MAPSIASVLHTPLCDLLGIRYPMCQAGMGFRGALGAGRRGVRGRRARRARPPRTARPPSCARRSARVRELTDRPFGVDILFATVRGAGAEVEQFTDA